METNEIDDEQWISFFDRFSKEHAGWPVTIEMLSSETGPQRLAKELPLQGLSFEAAGTRPCTVRIGAGDDPSATVSHTVHMPLHIRVAEDGHGGRGTILIEPAEGPPTLIHYHPPGA
jgi:hypothetical protein